MCCTTDFAFREQGKDETDAAYLKARRIDFIGKLATLPIKFYSVKKDDIPKGLLRSPTIKNYQKLMLGLFSCCLRRWLSSNTRGLFVKSVEELGMAEWVHGVERDSIGQVTEESKKAYERLVEWFNDAKDLLESDMAFQAVSENDPGCKWYMEKRMSKKYNDKLILAQYQAEVAKELASRSDSSAPINVTFSMGN